MLIQACYIPYKTNKEHFLEQTQHAKHHKLNFNPSSNNFIKKMCWIRNGFCLFWLLQNPFPESSETSWIKKNTWTLNQHDLVAEHFLYLCSPQRTPNTWEHGADGQKTWCKCLSILEFISFGFDREMVKVSVACFYMCLWSCSSPHYYRTY